MEDLVKIELTKQDAELFKFFQKHYDNIKKLEEAMIFDIKAKTVNLHIDHKGQIKDIDIILRCLFKKNKRG